MRRDDVAERLRKILTDHAGYAIAPHAIQPQTSLYGKGLGLSSLDVVSLIVHVEEEFEVFFDADEVGPSVATFGALLGTVMSKLPGDGRASSEEG